MEKKYNQLMKKCIALAKKYEGRTSPNPLVGCIIFDDNFKIISTGAHECYGQNHAERNAILNAKENLKGKNLIVNLEPCVHFGKTPPCADLIIEKGIKKVIIGIKDVNPIVEGKGIAKLKRAGIEVITGVLEEDCKKLNKFFIKNQTKHLPYITIKIASTLDGKIATKTYSSKWITDEASRKEVQKLRNKYDAILTSSTTVIKDNPSLTCRIKNGKNPIRIVLDTNLATSPDSKVYTDDGTKVYLITSKQTKKYPKNVEIIKTPIKNKHINLKAAVGILYEKGIRSILVEAGGTLNKSFIEENLADELVQFTAPKILGDNNAISFVQGFDRNQISECNNLKISDVKKLKNDIILTAEFI
ncbi:bifunctional diaminohydroxyphosphoribosylaminopyrimidine deaminase/5-amino-6-(5-phosphoribosylamino)uracil reductase RibD [bacterium]|nr:bifunctional diaminohydroxyphosphoribosylaminopyrimidine deaminase/5-amino-6-(5-phosphoribosylamino)uracil reductase RibD [bacterium]